MNHELRVIQSTSSLSKLPRQKNEQKGFIYYTSHRLQFSADPPHIGDRQSKRKLYTGESQTNPPKPEGLESDKKSRKEGPHEEFIETDPNWSRKMSEEEKRDIRDRAKNQRNSHD